jgi:hypothetical protein
MGMVTIMKTDIKKEGVVFKRGSIGAALLKELRDPKRVHDFCTQNGFNPNHSTPFNKAASRKLRAKWADKDARKGRGPAQFLMDEWKVELEGGKLTRRKIRAQDRELYQALATWYKRHKSAAPDLIKPLFSENPTTRVERELLLYQIEHPSDAYRNIPHNRPLADRLYQAAVYREKNKTDKQLRKDLH